MLGTQLVLNYCILAEWTAGREEDWTGGREAQARGLILLLLCLVALGESVTCLGLAGSCGGNSGTESHL